MGDCDTVGNCRFVNSKRAAWGGCTEVSDMLVDCVGSVDGTVISKVERKRHGQSLND